MDKGGSSVVDLGCDSSADLRGELLQWLSLTATSHEGPWQRARHLLVKMTGSSDASALGWGGVIDIMGSPYRAGGIFPEDWLRKHINKKEMFALYHLLRLFCERYPTDFQRAQVFIVRGRRANPSSACSRVFFGACGRTSARSMLTLWRPTRPSSGTRCPGRLCHFSRVMTVKALRASTSSLRTCRCTR